MASVRRQLVKTPLGYVTYVWLEGGVVPYEVLMAELDESLGKTVACFQDGYRTDCGIRCSSSVAEMANARPRKGRVSEVGGNS